MKLFKFALPVVLWLMVGAGPADVIAGKPKAFPQDAKCKSCNRPIDDPNYWRCGEPGKPLCVPDPEKWRCNQEVLPVFGLTFLLCTVGGNGLWCIESGDCSRRDESATSENPSVSGSAQEAVKVNAQAKGTLLASDGAAERLFASALSQLQEVYGMYIPDSARLHTTVRFHLTGASVKETHLQIEQKIVWAGKDGVLQFNIAQGPDPLLGRSIELAVSRN